MLPLAAVIFCREILSEYCFQKATMKFILWLPIAAIHPLKTVYVGSVFSK